MLGFQRELKNKKTQTERCILGGHWAVRVRAALALKKKTKNTQTERCILGGHWLVRVRTALALTKKQKKIHKQSVAYWEDIGQFVCELRGCRRCVVTAVMFGDEYQQAPPFIYTQAYM